MMQSNSLRHFQPARTARPQSCTICGGRSLSCSVLHLSGQGRPVKEGSGREIFFLRFENELGFRFVVYKITSSMAEDQVFISECKRNALY